MCAAPIATTVAAAGCGAITLPAAAAQPTQTGGDSAEKRAYRFAKNRLGSHTRALKKREEMQAVYSRQRAAAALGK